MKLIQNREPKKKMQDQNRYDGSVFAVAVLPTARQTAAARQSVSESIQNGFKFRLTFHKSTFFRPEEAAPWFEQCKNTDHKAVVFHKYLSVIAFAGSALQ
jgi:hypothetical protein